jgi:hypothetical protein
MMDKLKFEEDILYTLHRHGFDIQNVKRLCIICDKDAEPTIQITRGELIENDISFNDKVVVTGGFYNGIVGIATEYDEESHAYLIQASDKSYWIYKDNIQKIN